MLKDQIKLEEEKAARSKKQIYELQTESEDAKAENISLISKVKVLERSHCQLSEESDQLKESLELMNCQMDKVEHKIAQKCQKIEIKMQKKIDKYQAEIAELTKGQAG